MFSTEKIKKIHFIGIGGIGMSGMAELLAKTGYSISGSDLEENDRTIFLKKMGLEIYIGHDKDNVLNANLVVFSSAVKEDNIEIRSAMNMNIPIIRRAEMLAELVRIKPISVGVSGTHGKTTTCSLIGSILHNAKKDPTIVIGGIVKSFNTNAVSGSGDIIVVEADEYDRSFLSLKPVIAIINNIEEEHLDCYKDFSDLKNAFHSFANNIPFYGFVLVNGDDPNIATIIKEIKRPIIKYGIEKEAHYNAHNIRFNKNKTQFDLHYKNKKIESIDLRIPGYHNVYNSLCSISFCLEMGIEMKSIKKTLKSFQGVERRFDIKYNSKDDIYIDDYAHHPTEVKATIHAIKNGWPDKKIISIFQPHLYSRTEHLYKDFANALISSDKIMLLDIYGSRESKIKGVSSKLIENQIIRNGYKNYVKVNLENLIEELEKIHNKGEIIVTMGAGDLWVKGKDIIDYLSK